MESIPESTEWNPSCFYTLFMIFVNTRQQFVVIKVNSLVNWKKVDSDLFSPSSICDTLYL